MVEKSISSLEASWKHGKGAQFAQGHLSRNVSPGRVASKMFNQNSGKQRTLRKCIRDGLRAEGIGNNGEPLFEASAPLEARLVFYLPRPKHHFKTGVVKSGLPTGIGQVRAWFLDCTSLQYYCTKLPGKV